MQLDTCGKCPDQIGWTVYICATVLVFEQLQQRKMMLQMTLLVLALGGALAYPTGPPVAGHPDICTSMMPSHDGAQPQTTASPFEIKADTCFNENTTLNVQVKIKTEGDDYFEGFFIIARPLANGVIVAGEAAGTFDVGGSSKMQTLDCFNDTKSAAGQSKKEHYVNLVVQWTPPPTSKAGDKFKFVATFVHETDEFWVGVESGELAYDASCTPTVQKDAIITSGMAAPALGLMTALFSFIFLAFI